MVTSGGASMSTNVPTLHKMATYPAAGTPAKSITSRAATGRIASLTSPLPSIAPAAAAAASVSASHASVCGGSRAEVTLGRTPA